MKLASTLFVSFFLAGSACPVFAGDFAARDGIVQQSSVLPEFSMADVRALMLRGGNYWMGYFAYQVDLEKAKVTATWNKFDCSMKRATSEAKLTASDIQSIKSAVESLQYEALDPDEGCYLMADGDESSLTLIHTGDGEVTPPMYPIKSWHSTCLGKPLSDESYRAVEDAVFGILPQPQDAALYTEIDPDDVCPVSAGSGFEE